MSKLFQFIYNFFGFFQVREVPPSIFNYLNTINQFWHRFLTLSNHFILAEREGFEPSVLLTVHTLSKRAD